MTNTDEFDRAYRQRLSEGQARWHPGAYEEFEMRPFLERMIACTPIDLNGCSVLDLGWGTGQVSNFFAVRGSKVRGIDIFAAAIDAARKATAGLAADFLIGDFRTAEFPVSTVDLAIDCRFLHCVVNWADRGQVLSKIASTLKETGEFWSETMVGVPQIRTETGWYLDEEGIFWKQLGPGICYDRSLRREGLSLSPVRRIHPTLDGLNNEFQIAGFEILHQEIEEPSDETTVKMAMTRMTRRKTK